jgi:tetratricopeptide (TPR) repeat protein
MTLLRARALSAAGDLHGWIDDPQAYLRFADEALAIFRERGDVAALPAAIQNLGWAQLQTGHLEAAAANLSEARKLDVELGNLQTAANAMIGLGVLAVIEGRPREARPLYADALKIFKDLGNTYYVGLVECMFAQCDRNEGDLDAAENRIRLACPPTKRLRT